MKQQKRQKTICLLSQSGTVHGMDIAEHLGVSRPTTSVALKSLEQEGYLYLGAAHEVHLTDKGTALAKSIYEKTDL